MTTLCYVCRSAPGTTRDHVFPRQLFARPLPPDMITAPACDACQAALARDEDYLRFFITGGSYGHPEARRIWEGPMLRSFRRPEGQRFARAVSDLGKDVTITRPTDPSR